MAYILSIETATNMCSVALHKDGDLMISQANLGQQTHARLLSLQIESVISQAGIGYEKLDAVAVSAGPGSYTGLRIGISMAKGICFGLEIGLIGISTLQVMAAAVQPILEHSLLLPMLDARRMEVYTAVYEWKNSQMQELKSAQAHILDSNSFSELSNQTKKLFFGTGAAKAKPILEKSQNMYCLDLPYPMASNMGVLAYNRYKNNDFEHSDSFNPIYLKDANVTFPKIR